MTMHITPARPSLGMYGKTLAETTAVQDWAMRRLDQEAPPRSEVDSSADPLFDGSRISGLGGTTAVKDWALRRIDKRRLPASSLRGLGAGHTGTPAQRKWGVNPLAEGTAVKDWELRRIDQQRIPASSLRGLGAGHTGTAAQRKWGVNPIGETTFVNDMVSRRYGKTAAYLAQDVAMAGFGAFGSLSSTATVREAQTAARKLGVCLGMDGRRLAIDNTMGPNTRFALQQVADMTRPGIASSLLFSAPDDAHSLSIDGQWWAEVLSRASSAIDNCGAAADTQPADTSQPATTDTAPPPSDWMSSPWLWLGVAAAVGIGAYVYMNKDEQPQWDSSFDMESTAW